MSTQFSQSRSNDINFLAPKLKRKMPARYFVVSIVLLGVAGYFASAVYFGVWPFA